MSTIGEEIWDWVVETIEGVTPDDRRGVRDQFRCESGVLGREKRGPQHHRRFDLMITSADRAPSPHGPVAWSAELFTWPLTIGIIYVVELRDAKRVNLQIVDDATRIIRELTSEANWPPVQGTAAGTMHRLSATFTGLGGTSDEGLPVNQTVIALYDLEVEAERANWS